MLPLSDAGVAQVGGALFNGSPPGLAVRLLIDLACAALLVRGIYFRYYGRSDLFLTLFSFNISIFLITYLLNGVNLTMGAAFGLFAVFSMLRYRTDTISARDMTYLFLVIAVGLITSVSQVTWAALALLCAIVLVMTMVLESNILARRELPQRIEYEHVGLVAPDKRPELIADLRARTGLNIHRVVVEDIDLVRDTARLTAYYYESGRAP
jgi:hypothetical protein